MDEGSHRPVRAETASLAACRTLVDVWARAVRLGGDRPAVEVPAGDGRAQAIAISYRGLDAWSARLAERLAPLVRRERVVAILASRAGAAVYAAQLAAMKAGAGYVYLDGSFPDDRLRFMLEDADVAAVLCDADGDRRAARLGVDAARRVAIGAAADADVASAIAAPVADAAPAADTPWLGPSSLAYVVYTSGTTGAPKGVLIEHRGIVNLVVSDAAEFGLGAADRVVQGSSPAYDSSVEETWLAWAVGATLVVMDDAAARLGPDLVGWLRRERVTVFCPPPTLLRACACDDPRAALPDLKLLYVGGEALPQDVLDAWAAGRRMVNGYGPTECTVTVVRGDVVPRGPVVIGRPVPGHTAYVLDEDLDAVADGEEGELCIAGVGLARGYLNRPELTAEKFPVHPRFGRLYRTGDLVRRRPDGDLESFGRRDAQAKVRGYRIELEAIEAALAQEPGVRAAACRVQDDGAVQTLVACVVPADPAAPPDGESLRAALRRTLPEYSVPARYLAVDALPVSVGGKLDRRRLPHVPATAAAPKGATSTAGTPPRDDVEAAIAGAFGAALGGGAVGVDDDFFDALGGDSLRAALVVSRLRKDPRTAAIAVRDVYEARTVAALARRAKEAAAAPAATPRAVDVRGDAPPFGARGRPVLAATLQAAWLVGRLVTTSVAVYVAVFAVLPTLFELLGPVGLALAAPPLAALGAAAYALIAIRAAVLTKRALIGVYTPLRAPAWGSFFVRNWIVQQSVRAIPWRLLHGTEYLSDVLRALGAKIGRRVHIHRGVDLALGGWDLLEIGDDATIGQDAALRLVDLERGHVVVGPVRIGAGAVVDVRAGVDAGAVVEDLAELTPLSWLPRGARATAGRRFDGVPAADVGPAAGIATAAPRRVFGPRAHGALLLAARAGLRTAARVLPLAATAATAAAVYGLDRGGVGRWLAEPTLDAGLFAAAALLAPLDALFRVLGEALLSRALGRVRPGVVPRLSAAYVRVVLKTDLLETAGNRLSGTLFWPWWLRLAGMKVGRDCEVSTIIDVVPELIELGGASFYADGIYLGGPRVVRGTVELAATRLGARSFVGNHAVIRAGSTLPDDVLIGVCTTPDPAVVRPGTSWFGHPAFALPKREIVAEDPRLTHRPGPVRYFNRVFWESLRFALPIVPVAVGAAWYAAAEALVASDGSAFALLVVQPALLLASSAALSLAVLALKWLLLARVKPGRHALWSCWCSRWDFLYVAWTDWARGALARLEGTPFLAPYLRAVGCKIGKRTLLGGGFAQVVDPDMLVIEDDATVGGHFQAHSFEDRVLKIDVVRIGRGATVGCGAVLFYGADVGDGAEVLPHGVVMKHEALSPGLSYAGVPVRATAGPPDFEVAPEATPVATPVGEPARSNALDAARGLALVGMLVMHFLPNEDHGSAFDRLAAATSNLLYGKSAALFCVVAGFSVALAARRADATRALAARLLRRAAALAAAGYALAATVWHTDVLRAVAFMTLAAGAAARRGARTVVAAIVGAAAAATAAGFAWKGYVERDVLEDGTYVGLFSIDAAGWRCYWFDGPYPMLGWVAFPLFGALLARVAWREPGVAERWFRRATAVAVAAQAYAWWAADRSESFGVWAPLLAVEWSPATPAFLILNGAVSAALVAGFHWWAAEAPRAADGPATLAVLGRATLTHYVLHLGVVYAALSRVYPGEDWPASVGATALGGYLVVAAIATRAWFRRFAHGPFEAALRFLGGR
jgi:non-ribosomal peptide synthetase-like protein